MVLEKPASAGFCCLQESCAPYAAPFTAIRLTLALLEALLQQVSRSTRVDVIRNQLTKLVWLELLPSRLNRASARSTRRFS